MQAGAGAPVWKKDRSLRSHRWIVVGALGLLAVTTPLLAVALPRGTLWRVEQTCMLNDRTTGSPFPCLAVDAGKGVAVLRAPFRQTHVVAMPTVRVIGIEDPQLRQPGPNYFEAAWGARHFLQEELGHPIGWTDVGLAVNSRLTRSQDQLHIHVDCVRARVRREIAARVADIPVGHWLPDAYSHHGQAYFGRRIDQASLADVHVPQLIDEIPALREHPARAVVAVLGVSTPGQGDGFVLLAGESDPDKGDYQSTSEDLLDHQCRS